MGMIPAQLTWNYVGNPLLERSWATAQQVYKHEVKMK